MWCSAIGCIVMLTLSLLTTRLADAAQPAAKLWRLGILTTGGYPPSVAERRQLPFWQALHKLGWVEGRNITVEERDAEGYSERLPAFAADLVHLRVDVIVAFGTPAAQAAKQATATIPIVMGGGVSAPLETGLAASLARPGGNLTGVTGVGPEFVGKQMEILREAVPGVLRVGILWDPDNAGVVAWWHQAQVAAPALGITVLSLEVPQSSTLEKLFAAITQGRPEALFLFGNPFPNAHRTEIATFVAQNGLPTIGPRAFVQAGGLISYGGTRSPWAGPRAAAYVDKILQGAKPADLPIERSTKFELVINLKTAEALGMTIPSSLLILADEVIQ